MFRLPFAAALNAAASKRAPALAVVGVGSRRTICEKLFIGVVPPSTTTESLRSFFQSYGAIRDVRIVTPRQEDRRPYAFVEFEQVQSAVAAMEEMQFRRFEGRHIYPIFHVDKRAEQNQYQQQGGQGQRHYYNKNAGYGQQGQQQEGQQEQGQQRNAGGNQQRGHQRGAQQRRQQQQQQQQELQQAPQQHRDDAAALEMVAAEAAEMASTTEGAGAGAAGAGAAGAGAAGAGGKKKRRKKKWSKKPAAAGAEGGATGVEVAAGQQQAAQHG